ncbi:MAG: GSU2403 family nucleotidyltransferase fold protein [Myxococcota bacterium]
MSIQDMPDQDAALQLLVRAIRALHAYADQIVVTGGLVPLLYRSLPNVRQLDWEPQRTFDVDVTLPRRIPKGPSASRMLLSADLVCVQGRGPGGPTAEYYQDAAFGTDKLWPVHLEFLTSMAGNKSPPYVMLPIGLRVPTIRYLDLLLVDPVALDLAKVPGANAAAGTVVRLPQPATFVLQKALIRAARPADKRAKDMAYVHDVVMLSQNEWSTAHRIVADVIAGGGEHAVWMRRALKDLRALFANPSADGVVEAQRQLANSGMAAAPSSDAICEVVLEWLAVVTPG